MKKFLITIIVAVVLFAVGYNAYQSEKQATTGKQKVYAVLPLSGLYAQYGKDIKSMVDWYVHHKKPQFEVVYVDSAGEPSKALSAFQQKAMYAKQPIVLSTFTPISTVLLPTIKEKQGFLFSVSTIGITSDLNNYQIVSRSSEDIINILGPYINKRFKNIAIIYSEDEFGLREVKLMEKLFSGKMYKEAFNPYNPDVRIEVLKLIETNPDAVVVLGSPSPAYINIFKELKNHTYKGAILSDSDFTCPHTFKIIGDATENVISTIMSVETNLPASAQLTQLKQSYEKETGQDLYYIMAETFEVMELINYALDNHLPFSQRTFQNIGTWHGVSGDIQFLENGKSSVKSYVLVQVKDGKITPINESEER